jgi:hypothetical protein
MYGGFFRFLGVVGLGVVGLGLGVVGLGLGVVGPVRVNLGGRSGNGSPLLLAYLLASYLPSFSAFVHSLEGSGLAGAGESGGTVGGDGSEGGSGWLGGFRRRMF